MSKIKLTESGKEIELKSPKVKDLALIEEAQKKMIAGETTLQEFRMLIMKKVYPEIKKLDDWYASDLTQLCNVVMRYAQGGPDAVKNLLTPTDGTQTSSEA